MQKYSKQNSIIGQNYNFFNDIAYNKRLTKYSNKNFKLVCIFLLFIILLIIFSNFNICYAKNSNVNDEEFKSDILKEIDKQLDNLDLSSLDSFVNNINNEIGNLFNCSIKELIKKIINGEFITDFDSVVNYLLFITKNIFAKYLPVILFIVVISVISGILNGLTSGFINKQTTDIVNLVCYFAIIIVIFTALGGILIDVKNSVNNIKRLMDLSFPITLTLMLAMGGKVSNIMYKPLMLILSNVIAIVISNVIIPFFIASIVLTVVGNMSDTIKLSKLPKFFVTSSSWLLGIMFSIFSAFISLKGISGVMIDNISVSATKFCLSSYVPVLGGYVSDGFDLVLASCSLIKNSFGVTVLVVLVLTTMLPALKVIMFILSLKLAEAIIEPITDSKNCKLLSSISSSLVMLVSALIGLAFMFFILMFLIISTLNFSY